MVRNCCVVNCNNRSSKDSRFSFHCFPMKDKDRMKIWISRVSRSDESGKCWEPSKNARVCSAHFLPSDFCFGLNYKTLKDSAVPSVFPQYPNHKQRHTQKRPSPKKRAFSSTPHTSKDIPVPTKQIKVDHAYHCPSIELDLQRTHKKLEDTNCKLQKKSKEIKCLSQKLKRRDTRLSNLVEEMKKLRLLHEEQVEVLKDNFSEESLVLIENELKSVGKKKQGLRYSPDVRSFAVTLHYYSAAAYEFVRKHLHLPHSDTIRRWASSHNVQPGFLASVIDHLKAQLEMSPDMQDTAIMFDSMSIKKEVIYNKVTQKYEGFVNHGDMQTAAVDTVATEALTLMVVGLKKFFKQPIAYFLVDKISARQQAQMVRDSICLLTDAGFNVHAVICDGAFANQSTAQYLGCQISQNETKTSFPHPSDETKTVSFILDAAHLLKNIRNCLADFKVLRCGQELIKWEYILELHKIQSQNTLYLANKLRGEHIDYTKNKMKVSLAAQTLSSSVANAIEYLRDDMQLAQFAGSEATCRFIRMFDKLFDLCNSSNCWGKGFKSPINKCNFKNKQQFAEEAICYIRSLSDATGKSILSGKRKTGFLGFIVTLTSILTISQKLLFSSDYRFFLTYRLSQDHLETFFSKIRRRGGNNNNPNSLQFQWAIRALLLRNGVVASRSANSQALPDTSNKLFDSDAECSMTSESFTSPSSSSSSTTKLDNEHGLMIPELLNRPGREKPHHQLTEMLERPGIYHQHVLHYIAGFINRKMTKKIRCSTCISHLTSDTRPPNNSVATFTKKKDRGGLVFVSEDFLKVVTTTDRILRRFLMTQKYGPIASVSSLTVRLVTHEVLASLGLSVFLELKSHCMEIHSLETEDDHVTQIIKEICNIFCNIILTHHGKLHTERFIRDNKGSQRHNLTKRILFMHV